MQAEFEGYHVLLTEEELVHGVGNPGFEVLCKLCPEAATRKPTPARGKAALVCSGDWGSGIVVGLV